MDHTWPHCPKCGTRLVENLRVTDEAAAVHWWCQNPQCLRTFSNDEVAEMQRGD